MCARLPSGRLYRCGCCPLIAFYSERAKPVPFSALYFAAHGLVYVCGMLQSRSKLASKGTERNRMVFTVTMKLIRVLDHQLARDFVLKFDSDYYLTFISF